MNPAWLVVAGQAFDLVGFGMLAFEAFAAIEGEQAARADVRKAREAAMEADGGAFFGDGKGHGERKERLAYLLNAEDAAAGRILTVRGVRAGVGVGLVLFGFALQIVGTAYPHL
ncbi:MAG: hypothetical protein AAF311_17710 [Pseudomonadota bacterium]